jgi:malate dehydrogenase (oxaloacetate-decarboxylating)(NADP+)
MHGDCALDEALRMNILPMSRLKGAANLLVCPNVDAGNIAYNLLKTAAGSNGRRPLPAGRQRTGEHPHLQRHRSRIINMAALTVMEANRQAD